MRTPRIVEAMGNIDDDLVSEAIEYRRTPLSVRLFRKPFLKACACLVVVALAFGLVFIHNKNDKVDSSPFVLTAYATSTDEGSTTASVLEKGQRVPISPFETESGLTGFVVSYNKPDNSMPSSIAIISGGSYENCIEEISGIVKDPTQNYYFYIPGENEVVPYEFTLYLSDIETNTVCEYGITIEQIEGNFFVELVKENVMERITK